MNRWKIFFLILLSISSLFASSNVGVKAQTNTTIAFNPAESFIELNGTRTVTLQIVVENATNLNGFDITFTYDPSIVDYTGWTNGNMLKNLRQWVYSDQPGSLRLAFTQLGTAGYTGGGILLSLSFTSVSFGQSPINFASVVFTESSGYPYVPTATNGVISTIYNPGLVTYASLSGNISLQGQSLRGGIPVSLETGLYVGYGPYNTVSLAQPDNNYFFTSIVMDAYPIRTAFPTYLNLDASSNKVKGLVGTSNTLPMLVLLAGNVNTADNVINNDDLDLIRANFDLNTRVFKSSIKLNGDANGDGIVDIRDLALAGGNFGLNGATAYLDWMP